MKQVAILLALLILPLGLWGFICIPECEREPNWTLEVRGAYYQPSSKKTRSVYSSSLLDYQVTLAKRVLDFLEVWGEFDWAVKKGHGHPYFSYDENCRSDTKLSLTPISLGLKLIYPIFCRVDVYAGAGVSYSFLHIRNRSHVSYSCLGFCSDPLKKDMHKNGWGGLFKVGFQVALSEKAFLDFFADYYLQTFHFSRRNYDEGRSLFKHGIDCSGFKLGAGFGVYF
jgi:opacity protein-like surface antigen